MNNKQTTVKEFLNEIDSHACIFLSKELNPADQELYLKLIDEAEELIKIEEVNNNYFKLLFNSINHNQDVIHG
jgi:hypothetical protein